MGAEQQVTHRAHGYAPGESRVLHVHHVQFILVADKRGYNEGGHWNEGYTAKGLKWHGKEWSQKEVGVCGPLEPGFRTHSYVFN